MKKIIALITILAVALLFTGCFPQSTVEFEINFIVDGEIYDTVSTDKSSIKMPADPKKDGHNFDDWFWDKDVWEKPLTLNSLLDAPLSETWRVYAKFSSIENPNISSRFYRLQDAYDLGLLDYGDLHDISFYHHGDYRGATLSRSAYPKNPEFLSTETENKIKQTFLDDYNKAYIGNYPIDSTIGDITISNYCGTYHGAVVVFLEGLYGYYQVLTSETVAGITFSYNDGNYLRVFVEEEIYTITATAGEGGHITPSGIVEVEKGGKATFSVISHSTGDSHGIKSVYVDDERVDVLLLNVVGYIWKYTFENVTANHTIHAEFTPATQEVKAQYFQSSVTCPAMPLTIIENKAQLQEYYIANRRIMGYGAHPNYTPFDNFDNKNGEQISFKDAIVAYDDDYFKDKLLAIIYYGEGSGGNYQSVTGRNLTQMKR